MEYVKFTHTHTVRYDWLYTRAIENSFYFLCMHDAEKNVIDLENLNWMQPGRQAIIIYLFVCLENLGELDSLPNLQTWSIWEKQGAVSLERNAKRM